MTHVLSINSSARHTGSSSRKLTAQIVQTLKPKNTTERDLSQSIAHIDEAWVGANFTPADARTDAQKDVLAFSDTLVDELIAAEVIVIGLPVYNFGVPAAMKAWIDQVARVGRTFKYTETGPVGQLTGKKAIVAFASGGTKLGADVDFASTYLRHVLGFIGITDVTFVTSEDQITALAA
jgi:FMN-dependent NADH-azoreductase